jgi:hypothetical protein
MSCGGQAPASPPRVGPDITIIHLMPYLGKLAPQEWLVALGVGAETVRADLAAVDQVLRSLP